MKSKKIIDFATVGLLIVAFGMAYFTGLVGTKGNGAMMLNTGTFALISICASLVLMGVGGGSELMARVKNNAATYSFTSFMAVQLFAFFGICAICVALLSDAVSPTSGWIRGLFIVFVAIELLGYIQSVLYIGGTENKAAAVAAAADEPAEYADEPEEYEYYYTEEDEFGAMDDAGEEYDTPDCSDDGFDDFDE